LQFYCFFKFNISLSDQYRFKPLDVISIKCRGYFYRACIAERNRCDQIAATAR